VSFTRSDLSRPATNIQQVFTYPRAMHPVALDGIAADSPGAKAHPAYNDLGDRAALQLNLIALDTREGTAPYAHRPV
jgi:hypothetical protein